MNAGRRSVVAAGLSCGRFFGNCGWDDLDQVGVDLDRYGSLQQVYGDYDAMFFADPLEDAFEAGEGAELDADALAGGEVGAGAGAGDEGSADVVDFRGGDDGGDAGEGDDVIDGGAGEDGDLLVGVELTEDIAGEDGSLDYGHTVGVAAAFGYGGSEGMIAADAEGLDGGGLGAGMNFECKPVQSVGLGGGGVDREHDVVRCFGLSATGPRGTGFAHFRPNAAFCNARTGAR